MKQSKIAFFETESWEEQYLKGKLKLNAETAFFSDPLTDENIEVAKGFEIISPFIYSDLGRKTIEQLPELRMIATRSTGFDHIDMKACMERNIPVSNVPVYGTNTVAEHTFALILALSRKLLPSVERTRRGNFSLEGLVGFDLKNRVLGVVGTGHIGQHVIRIANGFQMKVVAHDPRRNEVLARDLDFRYESLDDLLRNSDVVTLHAPYNPVTHHMINRKNIRLMKPGSILINTSRGGLIETAAIVEALQRRTLAGAGLDVIEEEVLVKEERELLSTEHAREELRVALETHILLFRDDVIITPHNAFNSVEAVHRILNTTVNNIDAYLQGAPQNTVRLKAA